MSDENRQTGGTPQEATPVPPSPPDATLDHRGDSTIVGDYELLDEVARGGMGVVYRARQRSLDRIVALKLILSGGDASEEELSRFRVEAQASARLDHPYIVPVYGFGRLDGHPFLAMGFVNGPSLAVRLARNGPLPAREAAELLCKVAEAIHFAHSQGIIHRDLKPGNVLIDQDGEPRVTDFGLAKRQDMEHGLTNTGQVLGTPAYMPPEQAAGDQVGPTGDIYSLGATLYAALCGQPPFEATSLPELLMKVAEEPPQPLEERDRRIPPALSAICQRCLAKRPEERYPTAQDLVDDLQRFLSGSAVLGARSRRSIRWPLLVGGTLALVLLASGIGWAWFGRGQPVEETRVAPAAPAAATLPLDPNAPTEAERTLLADMAAALEMLTPKDGADPWELRFAESATAFREAFVKFGLDPSTTSADDWTARLSKRPTALRESILNALERWEYAATAAKQTDGPALRAMQMELDEVEWRRKARLLRDDNNPAALLAYLKDLDLATHSDEQCETLALSAWAFPPETADATGKLLDRLRASQPNAYWTNLAAAARLISRAKAQPAEQTRFAAEAVAPLRAAQAARPTSSVPVRQLADVFERLGNSQTAQAERERAVALEHPAAWEQVERARRSRAEGHLIEAIAAADQACELAPQMLPAAVEAVQARLSQTPPEENEAAMRRLANLPPTDEDAMKVFLAIHEANAQPERKRANDGLIDPDDLARNLEAWRNVTVYRDNAGHAAFLNLAKSMDSCGLDGMPAILEARRRSPHDAATLRACVTYLFEHNVDHSAILAMAEEAIALDPKTGRHNMDLAIALTKAREGDVATAREMFRNEIAERTKSPNDLYTLPWQQHFGRAYGLAADVAQDLQADGPRRFAEPWLHELCRLQLVAPALSEEEVSRELSRLSSIVFRNKFNSFWLGKHVQAAVRCGNMARPAAILNSRLIETEQSPQIWMAIALVSLQRGDLELAVLASERSSQLLLEEPYDKRVGIGEVELVRGLSYLSSDRLPKASQCLSLLCQAYRTERCLVGWAWPWTGGFQGDYARTLIALGKLEEAEQLCEKQRQMRPEDANIAWASGLVELAKERPAAALPYLTRATQLDSLNAAIELDLARAMVAAGDLRDALPHLQTAVQRAERGQLRGFRLVAAEAAEAALRIADDASLDDATRRNARGKAYLWFRDHLARWIERARDGADDDLAAVAQQLPKLLVCPAAMRMREESFRNSLSATHRAAWDELWKKAETTASEATARYAAMPKDRLQQLVTRLKVNESEVARKILSQGGSLTFVTPDRTWVERHVTRADALPQSAFNITAVSYRDCSIDDQDLTPLAKLPSLKHVFLDRTKVTDVGVQRLVKRAYALRTLTLNGTQVTKDLLLSLPPLETVSLRDVSMESAAMEAFSQAHPQVVLLPRLGLERPSRTEFAENVKPSFAMRFDGESRVNLPLKRNANELTTIEAWVQVPAEIFTSYGYVVVGRGVTSGGKSRVLGVNLHDRNLFRGESRDANGANFFTPPGDRLPMERWMHLAAVFNGKELRFYANGELRGTRSLELPADNTSLDFAIGAFDKGDWPFVGLIDEVRISSIARYEGDFVPPRRFEPDENTLALYHFDEGSGEIVHDSSGHGHDGKVIGSPKWIPEAETEE
ncbi:MAG: protein kinase [Pirellulales bacterium]